MKVLTAVLSVSGLALLTGCGPELAQAPYGSEEAAWMQAFRENYSGYRPPRMAPPATVDNVSPRLIEAEQQSVPAPGDAVAPAAADDPADVVDKAAADKEEKAPAEETAAPAATADPAAAVDKAAADGEAKAPEAKEAAADKKAAEFANTPPEPTSGTVYVVKAGDTLGAISRKQYGKASFADVIRRANVDLVKDPNRLRPGMKLIIPKL